MIDSGYVPSLLLDHKWRRKLLADCYKSKIIFPLEFENKNKQGTIIKKKFKFKLENVLITLSKQKSKHVYHICCVLNLLFVIIMIL